jgi:putrescine transport system ATP-binding protein
MEHKPDFGVQAAHAQAQPQIEIRGLVKRYGPLVALDAIDLTIHRGELFSLVGSSGCGKTTLLRSLAGFVRPDAGQILIAGRDMAPLEPHERPVNMMFQSYALFPHMSVEDNIAFGLRRERLDRSEIRRRVGEALALIQMTEYARRRPHQLSGGQRQRVALARAVVKRPQVLLLDEPLSALDKKLRENTQFELIAIQEQLGITFVMVTHDQEEAMTMSTRIAVMSEGRIVQIGAPSEIYNHPASRFVANFIGTINLIAVEQTADADGSATLRSQALGAALVAPSIGAEIGATLSLGVRPERIVLGPPDQPLAVENEFVGLVVSSAFVGDRRVYQVAIEGAGGAPLKVSTHNNRAGAEHFARGDRVRVGWRRADGQLLRG